MELYLDIFILENTLLNLFVIILTSILTCNKVPLTRKLLGAFAGTAFAVFIVILSPTLMESYIVKLIISGILVLLVYFPINVIDFFKTFAIFCLSAMIVAGTMFFLMAASGTNFLIMDGICVVNGGTKAPVLFLTLLLCMIFVKVLFKLKKVHAIKDRLLVPLIISIDEKIVSISALIDTGNLLCDPLTNLPVIIAEFKALKDILPDEIAELVYSLKKIDSLELSKSLDNSVWLKRLRLIPFSSLGNEGDILLGFRPDLVEIGDDKRRATNVIVGIYKHTLSKTMEFQALLGPQLI